MRWFVDVKEEMHVSEALLSLFFFF